MNRARHLHHLLVAAYPVLALFSHNVGQVAVTEVWATLAGTIAAAFFIERVLRKILRDQDRSTLLTSLSMAFFFSYGHVHNALIHIDIGSFQPGVNRHLFPFWTLLCVSGWILVIRTRRVLAFVSTYVAAVFLLLVVFSMGSISLYKARSWITHARMPAMTLREVHLVPPESPPDIYYVILDRYGSRRTLQEQFGFDNREFLAALAERGFFVADSSFANYPITSHSLASSLNMHYPDYLEDMPHLLPDDWSPLFGLLQDHEVGRLLRSIGYRYVHIGSAWHPTSGNRHADRVINYYFLPEFPRLLSQTTMLLPVFSRLGINDVRREKFVRVHREFKDLLAIATRDARGDDAAPLFVFAHFLLPHQPYVLDEDGSLVSQAQSARRSEVENYIRQLTYANTAVLAWVDTLLARSVIDPIVIIQADEGPYPLGVTEPDFNFMEASQAQLQHKLGILNALHLPGIPPNTLYPTMTPVNTFRLVFREYFGAELPSLPDSSYIFPTRKNLYAFENVTTRIR
jgi:hypothetical protein